MVPAPAAPQGAELLRKLNQYRVVWGAYCATCLAAARRRFEFTISLARLGVDFRNILSFWPVRILMVSIAVALFYTVYTYNAGTSKDVGARSSAGHASSTPAGTAKA